MAGLHHHHLNHRSMATTISFYSFFKLVIIFLLKLHLHHPQQLLPLVIFSPSFIILMAFISSIFVMGHYLLLILLLFLIRVFYINSCIFNELQGKYYHILHSLMLPKTRHSALKKQILIMLKYNI